MSLVCRSAFIPCSPLVLRDVNVCASATFFHYEGSRIVMPPKIRRERAMDSADLFATMSEEPDAVSKGAWHV